MCVCADLTGNMLSLFFGRINPRTQMKSELRRVNQWNYLPNGTSSNSSRLMRYALLYVPQQCSSHPEDCRIHMYAATLRAATRN